MNSRPIKVVFRFDDPSAKSNWQLEEAILGLFRSHGLPLTVAVVPKAGFASRPVAIAERIPQHLVAAAREGWLEVAQHGLTHQVRSSLKCGKPSEFCGLAQSEQEQLMREGLSALQSVFGNCITGFVPPFNSFDSVTIAAARQVGFGYLSGGLDYPSYSSGLALVPQTCGVVRVREVVTRARRIPLLDRCLVVVLHHYDFLEDGSGRSCFDLPALSDLLSWVRQQKDISTLTLADAAQGASARAWFHASWLLNSRERLHRRIRQFIPTGFLLTFGRSKAAKVDMAETQPLDKPKVP